MMSKQAVVFHDNGGLPNKIWVRSRAPENVRTSLLNKTSFEKDTTLEFKQKLK